MHISANDFVPLVCLKNPIGHHSGPLGHRQSHPPLRRTQSQYLGHQASPPPPPPPPPPHGHHAASVPPSSVPDDGGYGIHSRGRQDVDLVSVLGLHKPGNSAGSGYGGIYEAAGGSSGPGGASSQPFAFHEPLRRTRAGGGVSNMALDPRARARVISGGLASGASPGAGGGAGRKVEDLERYMGGS